MNKEIESYLQKHIVKDFGSCIQYDTFKECIIGSYFRVVYWKDHIYYYQGLEGNEYHKVYGQKAIIEIPILGMDFKNK